MSMRRDDTLRPGLAAVSALITVLAGDAKGKDRGQLTRGNRGTRHLPSCEIGLYLTRGSAATGGDPCSRRCQQAHEALRLGAVFLQALIDECGDVPVTEQLRLLGEAV